MKHLFFIAVMVSVFGCNSNVKNQFKGRLPNFTFENSEEENYIVKRFEGELFKENLKSRVEMKIVKSEYAYKTIAVTVSHYEGNVWNQIYSDTIDNIYIECDSLAAIDLNHDGSYEFLFQRFEGMGNITDYFFTVYGMKNGQFVLFEQLSGMPNVSFQSKESVFTTFEKAEELYIGRKYSLDKSLNFKLIMEQQLIESESQWQKKNYTVKDGEKILKSHKIDDSLNEKFYDFLHWCD